MTEIGKYIKNAREEKGLSQRQLAKLANINNSELSKIESGIRKDPSLKVIKALSRYLDITYADCLYIMKLGASYNPNNLVLITYYKNLDGDDLKSAYKNIVGKIYEYDRILSYLKEQYNRTDNLELLIDTIKSYEYENKTNNYIREILEEKILKDYLKS